MESFADRLKHLRETRGMTQEQLAQAVNVTRQAISCWERGRTEPDIATICALCEVFGVDTAALISGCGQKTYLRFQKRHVIRAAVTLSVGIGIFLLQLFVGPRMKEVVHTTYQWIWEYFFLFQILLPIGGWFVAGICAVNVVALFRDVTVNNRWRKALRMTGWVVLLPSVAVMVDDVLVNIIEGYKSVVVYTMYYTLAVRLPPLHALLFGVLPVLSGALLILGMRTKEKGTV